MKKANRYAQLEAQASLLKARLATEKEATYEAGTLTTLSEP